MIDPTLANLLVQQSKADIFAAALQIAQLLNLPVTSWQTGDPTRSLYWIEAEQLGPLERVAVGYIQSGFLDYAALPIADADGNILPVDLTWLTILAKQVYDVDVPGPDYAETEVVLTNGGGLVGDFAAGDIQFKNSSSGKTYHNTTGGHLAAGGTLTVTATADETGSDSSAGAGEIDTIVTGLLGVTCSNPAAAVGSNGWDAATIISQCRAKLGSFSPNGPARAYEYVARNAALTGINTIERAIAYADSETGDVTVYVAGGSGFVSLPEVAAVQTAINQWATPLCITPSVFSATPAIVSVTYTLYLYSDVNQTPAQIQSTVQTALEKLFKERPIGGDIVAPATSGALYTAIIESTIGGCFRDQTFRVDITLPNSSQTPLANSDVPMLGAVHASIVLVPRRG